MIHQLCEALKFFDNSKFQISQRNEKRFVQAFVDSPPVWQMPPGKRWQSKHRTTHTQVTSIFMIEKKIITTLKKGWKNMNKRKLESKIVEMMIKVHPVDWSELTSIGPDELFLTEHTESIAVTVSATVSVRF